MSPTNQEIADRVNELIKARREQGERKNDRLKWVAEQTRSLPYSLGEFYLREDRLPDELEPEYLTPVLQVFVEMAVEGRDAAAAYRKSVFALGPRPPKKPKSQDRKSDEVLRERCQQYTPRPQQR